MNEGFDFSKWGTQGGILGGQSRPQGGILGGNILGIPRSDLGVLAASLKDAGAYFSGRPEGASALLPAIQQQGERAQVTQLLEAVNSPDPTKRAQGRAAIEALGMDSSRFEKAQATQAMPQLMANMLPQTNQVEVTPQHATLRQSLNAFNKPVSPDLPMQYQPTTQQAIERTGSPELSAQMAPEIIKQQMEGPKYQEVGGSLYELPRMGGGKPTMAIEGPKKAPTTREVQIGGQKVTQEFDPSTGAWKEVGRGAAWKPDANTNGLGGGAGVNALNTYPAGVQSTVKAMLEGRQAPPSGAAIRSGYWQQMLALANAEDPTFDQTQWGARASARKDMLGGGKSYVTLNSGNTAIQHLGRLHEQIGDVSGAKVPLVGNLWNAGVNAVEQASGVPGVNAYNDTLGHLAEETTKFYRGAGGAEADISRNMSNLGADLSKEQKGAGVKNTVDLIYGKLAPMVEQYNKTMGTNYPTSHFLSAKAVETIKKMGFDPDTGSPVAAAPQGAGGWTVKRR